MNEISVPVRAYSYLRMSSQQQLRGDSLRRQLEKSREYARQNGLDLVESDELKDIGKSAFKNQHISDGVLGAFLERVEDGDVPRGSVLIVENLDRLSRDEPLAAVSLLQKICRHGITVVTLIDGQQYTDLNNNQMQLLLSVLTFVRAYEESKTKQERLRASWKARRANIDRGKVTSVAPKWLKPERNKEKKTVGFTLIEARADVVRRIFRESSSGLGANSIARRLNAESIPTFGRSTGWQPSYVKKILSSRTVVGEYQPHELNSKGKRIAIGDAVPGYYPAIVSDEIFASANAAIAQRHPNKGGGGRTGQNYANLFKRLLFCANCGSTIRILNKGKPPKGGRYLICDAANRGLKCTRKVWRYDTFERAFFHHAELHLGIRDALEASERMLPTLDGKIAVAKARLETLQRQAAIMDESFGRMKDGPTQSTLERRAALEDDQAATQHDIKRLVAEREEKKFSALGLQQTNFDEMYSESDDVESKRALAAQCIKLVVSRIDVSTTGVACFFSERWRRRLDGSLRWCNGMFDPIDEMQHAPSFAIQFRDWPGGRIVQPNPHRPEFFRFACPLRPSNYRELDPKSYRRGLPSPADGACTFDKPEAEFIYWPSDDR